MFTPQLYRKWLTIFAQIENPVVAYFDSAKHASLMRVLRQKHPKTHIVVVDRSKLWSFTELQPHIAEIFSQQGYPWNPPNTVVSSYSAAMHAKYELMQWTIRDNPFQSAYICWLDVGLFRGLSTRYLSSLTDERKSFRLWLPPYLDSGSVAYSLISPYSSKEHLTANQVVRRDSAFVCGCFFIGRIDVMWNWTTEYLMAVERMVAERWISTDQQVLYWLFLGEGRTKLEPKTSLQVYKSDNVTNPWFYLGYLAKRAGENSSFPEIRFNLM